LEYQVMVKLLNQVISKHFQVSNYLLEPSHVWWCMSCLILHLQQQTWLLKS